MSEIRPACSPTAGHMGNVGSIMARGAVQGAVRNIRGSKGMQVFLYIAYFVIGLVQLFAIMDGLDYATGIDGFFGFLIAAFTTYIPLLGAGLGVYGAVNVWDWSWIQAGLLFFWFVPVFILFAIFDRS